MELYFEIKFDNEVLDNHNGWSITTMSMVNHHLVIGDINGLVTVNNIYTKNEIQRFKIEDPITTVSFTKNNKHVVIGSMTNKIMIFNLMTGKLIKQYSVTNIGH